MEIEPRSAAPNATDQGTTRGRYDDQRALDPTPDSSYGKLLALVPSRARVLDVGCAWGGFCAALRRLRGCTVVGVEIDPVEAEAARARCDELFIGDVAQVLDRLPRNFDVVVAADVLEHLADPKAVLQGLAGVLRPGGVVLASIPNVTHLSVILSLAAGRFPRTREGLLDATHVQFFGHDDVLELFRAAGYAAAVVDRVRIDPRLTEFKSELASIPEEVLAWLDRNPEGNTYQFIVRAVPRAWAAPKDDAEPAAGSRAATAPVSAGLAREVVQLHESLARYHENLSRAMKQSAESQRIADESRRESAALRAALAAAQDAPVRREWRAWATRCQALGALCAGEREALRVLYVADRTDAPFRYRCVNACEQLRDSGILANVAQIGDPALEERIAAYSLVVLFRLPWSERVAAIVGAARRCGAAVGCDFDDLVFDPAVEPEMPFFPGLAPETKEAYRLQFAGLRRTLAESDFCIAATPTIALRARRLGAQSVIHPNLLSRTYVRLSRVVAAARPTLLRVPMIGYLSGSNTHDADLASIAEPLAQVLAERPDALLTICGYARVPDRLRPLAKRIVQVPHQDYRAYPWLMARCAAVVAPIEKITDFTNAKSALKVFEPGAFAVPVVASPTFEYAAAIADGISGFVATNDEEWKRSLLHLCDRQASLDAGAAARRLALEEHGPDRHANVLARTLLPRCGKAARAAEPLVPVEGRGVLGASRQDVRQLAKGVSLAARLRNGALQFAGRRGVATHVSPLSGETALEVARLLALPRTSEGVLLAGSEPIGTVLVDRERPLARFPSNAHAQPLESASRGSRFRAVGADPSFLIEPWHVSPHAYVAVQMSAVADGEASSFQFFWRTADSPDFSEGDSFRVPIIADGRMRTYVVDLADAALSAGIPDTAAVVRFDPLGHVGTFEVAAVALLSRTSAPATGDMRSFVAERFLRGDGIEIGALQNPLPLPRDAHVTYVDRRSVTELRTSYPELDGQRLVDPGILADAENLSPIPDESQDFVVCNHVLEHMRDPLGALQQWLRVLKPGGHLYVAIPDRANPLDRGRKTTPFRHLVDDHAAGGRKGSEDDRAAYFECVRSAHAELAPADQDALAERYFREDYSIHFHAFDRPLFERVLEYAARTGRAGVVELVENTTEGYVEYIAILRKRETRRRPVDVVVPVYNARELTRRCLESVLRHGTGDFRLVVVDDASTEPGLRDDLEALAADSRVFLLRNEENCGFVKTANRGMRLAQGRDILVLNSDTEVFAGFLDRLRDAATADDAGGIVTPFSNNATIFSVPSFGDHPIPEGHTGESMAAMIAAISRRLRPEMPTAVGFCMYLRSDVVSRVGLFDEVSFGRGFGEENDLCERAIAAGFKVRLCDDVFVWHKGKASFGVEGRALEHRNTQVIRQMHPRYEPAVARFCRTNPIAPLHREIAFHIPRLRNGARGAPLYLLHASPFDPSAGGTEHHVRDLVRTLAFPRVVIGFPRGQELVAAEVLDGNIERSTELRFPLAAPSQRFCIENAEIEHVVRRWLDAFGIAWVHVHHLMFWPIVLGRVFAEAGVPYLVSAHDYYSVCPSFNLFDYATKNGCECPHGASTVGDGCLAAFFAEAQIEPVRDYAELRRLHRKAFVETLSGARAIVTPSRAARDILTAHLPVDADRIEVIGHAHENLPRALKPAPGPLLRIGLVGQIAYPLKGSEQYLEVMRRTRDLPIEWHVFGSVDRFGYAEKLQQLGLGDRLRLHGAYERDAIVRLLCEAGIDLCLFLSVVDETFSFTLSESFLAGVPALVLDRGALGERVRDEGAGVVVGDVAEAASAIEKLCGDRDALAVLTRKLASYRHRTADEQAERYRELYTRLGFPLAPDAELRAEWLQEIGERAGVPAASLSLQPPRQAMKPQIGAPTSPYTKRAWYPLYRAVKPLMPQPVLDAARRSLLRVASPPAIVLRVGRAAKLHALQLRRRAPGAAAFTATSDDPQIVFRFRPFDPAKVKEVRFRLRREQDGFAFAQLFWTHHLAAGFSEELSAQVDLTGKPGEWREYSVRLDAPDVRTQWEAGPRIVRLRFDPTNVPGPFELGPLEFRTS